MEEEEERVVELARRAAVAPPTRSPVKSVSPPESRACERLSRARSVHGFVLYKTVICKYWELKMACPKGTRCTYAHGPKELRPPHVSSHAKQTSPRWKDRGELVAVSEHTHQEQRVSGARNKSIRSLSPTETRSHDGERRHLEEALITHSSAAPATIRKRRRSMDLPWGRGLRNISKKRRKRRLSASSTGSGSSGLDDPDPRRRDRSLNPSIPPRVKRDDSNDDDFDEDDHILLSFVEPIAEDDDDSIAGDQDEDPYSPLYSPFSIIETDSEPTPQSRERSTVSPCLEKVCRPGSPLAPMSSVAPVQIQPLFPPLAPTATASASAPAPAPAPAPALPFPPAPTPQPRPASPVVIGDRLVPSDRDYFRTYFTELARRKKTVRPIP
ncbi:BZ3500_MvSof-1268-A1-R1_Chr3-1g05498 [Microbotryum saponariae]|uniref:BZ3500_MvSof-1268-A1-R1_Chr3-1g05498 protein n=1 Tax=Microbotryum saponariae TaxID=289078 RepID=A0A2X0LFS4_9BASI|nr:BZ3500_MvSof-1268-A1-R1_Chr3-1g05498 [Microbotryum saponariae]SDA04689.1 BZ3501_MvSof-1269-A2-R1_Chr3-1g05169 [Microbotryum saponariae]